MFFYSGKPDDGETMVKWLMVLGDCANMFLCLFIGDIVEVELKGLTWLGVVIVLGTQ